MGAMTRCVARFALAAILIGGAGGPSLATPADEHWSATSTTAMGITGDIVLSSSRLKAAGAVFPLKVAADLPDYLNSLGQHTPARVLAVTRAMDPKLLRGNRLGCGPGKPARWIVVYRTEGGKGLGLEAFAGATMPRSSQGEAFCGSFSYQRK